MKKRLPSLTSNFATLITDNSFYVDKTQFIEKLEAFNHKNLFFLRPRRFGKSLLLSTLEHYYGLQYKDNFDRLFGDYYIGKNPTSLKNSYHVLRFDFSGIENQDISSLKLSFNKKLSKGFSEFYSHYKNFSIENLSLENEQLLNPADYLLTILNNISLNDNNCRIFLLIDEYDHFTNELFSFKREDFKGIVSQNGWLRKVYEVIKQFMSSGLVDRFFTTGVTPVTLDSLTSGFNVAKNITLEASFHNIAGFTEGEVKQMISGTFTDESKFNLEQLIFDIRDWYNGSRFSLQTEEKLYNPQLVINFLTYFSTYFEYPAEMYDPSISSDYSKIKRQLGILSDQDSQEVISQLIENEKITEGITLQYNFENKLNRTDLVSLLFYNGLLTIGGGEGKLIEYVVPNYVVKIMYWDFLKMELIEKEITPFRTDDLMAIFDEMRFDGKINKLINYISELMQLVSNRDLVGFRESNLKMLFMPVLSFASIYKISSEIEINRSYIDLFLKLQPNYRGKYSFIFELKYVKQTDAGKYEDIKTNGIQQLSNYLKLNNLDKDENLKAFLILFLNNKGESILIT